MTRRSAPVSSATVSNRPRGLAAVLGAVDDQHRAADAAQHLLGLRRRRGVAPRRPRRPACTSPVVLAARTPPRPRAPWSSAARRTAGRRRTRRSPASPRASSGGCTSHQPSYVGSSSSKCAAAAARTGSGGVPSGHVRRDRHDALHPVRVQRGGQQRVPGGVADADQHGALDAELVQHRDRVVDLHQRRRTPRGRWAGPTGRSRAGRR